jgi:hypothetical protein
MWALSVAVLSETKTTPGSEITFARTTLCQTLQELFISFPNALTPEVHSVMEVLKEYAKSTKGGFWILKPLVQRRQGEHNMLIEEISNIGKKAGYQVHADIEGWRDTPISIKTTKEKLDRIKEIDTMWVNKDGEITHIFEVENTTGVTEAKVRGANVSGGSKVKRIIIIPEDLGLLLRKVQEPALEERIKSDKWRFIWHDDLKDYYEEYKRKEKLVSEQIAELEELAKPLPLKPTHQEKIQGVYG